MTLSPSLMPYFLRMLAGMLIILLLVTVAVSVITMYNENYHVLRHLHGARSDTDCFRELPTTKISAPPAIDSITTVLIDHSSNPHLLPEPPCLSIVTSFFRVPSE